MDFFDQYPEIRGMAPVPKLLCMIFMLAIRDKCETVTFIRKRGTSKIKVLSDNQCDPYPPPRHLFSAMARKLLQAGRKMAKYPDGPFQFRYVETGKGQKLYWRIIYNDDKMDPAETFIDLMGQEDNKNS